MKKILFLCFVVVLFLVPAVSARRNLDVTFLNQNPDPVEPGEYVELRWKLENTGDEDIFNSVASIKPKYPFLFDSEDDRVITIRKLSAELERDKAFSLKFRARVDENAIQGEYELELEYSLGGAAKLIDKVTVDVESRQVTLVVAGVEITPETPKPGEQFDLEIRLKNLGTARIDNTKVKLDLEGTSFTTLASSSEQVITRLSGNSEAVLQYRLISAPDASSEVHKIPLIITYYDKFSKEYTLTSQFGLILDAPPDYLMTLENSEVYVPKTTGRVVVSFSNIGVSDINFVTTELLPSEDYEIISNPVVYLGNLESDDFETAEYVVYPKKEGILQLKIRATFKDSFNKEYEEFIDIPLPIYSQQRAQQLGLVKKKSQVWIVLLLIVAGVIAYFYRKKKR